MPKHLRACQNPIGKSNSSSSSILALDYKHLVNRKQTREILRHKMSGILGGIRANVSTVSVESGPMARILVNIHFIPCRKGGPATKDGNLSVTDEYVNSTLWISCDCALPQMRACIH